MQCKILTKIVVDIEDGKCYYQKVRGMSDSS